MTIWIDLANAPHVPFFSPIIDVLASKGHDVRVTLRDFNRTIELANRYGIVGTPVGVHGGRSYIGKALNFVRRSRELANVSRDWHPDVAVSHNSYTHTLAARLIGCQAITIMDYEGQPANHVAFRLAHKVIVPDCFPDRALRRFGARRRKVVRYSGFKEQLYLSSHQPTAGFESELKDACQLHGGWSLSNQVLVTVRTPATMAVYHRFENKLFDRLLARLNELGDVTTVVLPRTDDQAREILERYPDLRIPLYQLDGRDLVCHSDLVISAGGTMNREAAILGTPVWTVFAGELPAVDRRLVELGRMNVLTTVRDVESLRFRKKVKRHPLPNESLCELLTAEIVSMKSGRIRRSR